MPYDIDYTSSIPVIPPYTSKIKYSLNEAVQRQAAFHYSVSLGHYKDSEFIDEAIQRYKKFLYLKRANPKLFIVPMYDVDLVWHTHQLCPTAYRHDTLLNLQQVLHHDDTVQDRKANSKLSTSDNETRHKWFELYGDRLPKNGAMFRGATSKGIFQQVTNYQFLLECQRYPLFVQFIENDTTSIATGLTPKDIEKNVSTVVPLHDQPPIETVKEQFFAQFNTSEQEVFVRGSSGNIEAHFEADFNDFSENLTLKIQQKAGVWPMNYFSSIAEFPIPMEKILAITQFDKSVQTVSNTSIENDSNALHYLFDHPIESDSALRRLRPNAKRFDILHISSSTSVFFVSLGYQ
jgi:hypothetical protein